MRQVCISFQLRSNAAFTHPWTDPVQDGGHDPARPSPGLRRLQDRCAEAELGEAVSHLPPDSGRRRVRGLEEQAEEGTDQLVRHGHGLGGAPCGSPPDPGEGREVPPQQDGREGRPGRPAPRRRWIPPPLKQDAHQASDAVGCGEGGKVGLGLGGGAAAWTKESVEQLSRYRHGFISFIH